MRTFLHGTIPAALLMLLSYGLIDLAAKEPPSPPLSAAEQEQIDEWRKTYPYQSITDRLQYEAKHRPAAPPKLSKESLARMKEVEYVEPSPKSDKKLVNLQTNTQWRQFFADYRTLSLQGLHTDQVQAFVRREGVGEDRMAPPGKKYFNIPEAKPIDVVKLPPLSDEEASTPPQRLARINAGLAPPDRMPSHDAADSLHAESVVTFANPFTFGHVKDRDHVAGFVPHTFGSFPRLPTHEQLTAKVAPPWGAHDKQWQITRLELVSLLKHETPRVYLSEHLPQMKDLSSKKTRDLDTFESQALDGLRDGEEIQTAATPNRIVMLGAVRASKQCLQCHEVPRGTLLGAFSYELRRDPPVATKPATDAVQ